MEMVDLDWKAKNNTKSSRFSSKLHVSLPSLLKVCEHDLSPAATVTDSSFASYEAYLRLPELRKLWSSTEFPNWKNEPVLKPALQALEISFRFISTVLSDPRLYVNRREWNRRLESLTTNQIHVIALLCEDDDDNDDMTRGTLPIVNLSSSNGVLVRDGSFAEVWKLPGETMVVSRTSEASLLPRLATWQKSEDTAEKILYTIECEMRRCPYTLGLGEPNLKGKPNLEYDRICRPNDLHHLKKIPTDLHVQNHENQTLYATLQILESWIQASKQLLKRIESRVAAKSFAKAASDCWILERIWKLLTEIEDLHLLIDPDDFFRLKNQLAIKTSSESEALCFRSKGLIEITKQSKELKHKVPYILGVDVDPKGGPRIQEAAMKLYRERGNPEKIHLLQALQAIESALKRFFFAYKQTLVMVMGSLEAKAYKALLVNCGSSCDSLSQLFLEPTYYPSLDAAKTFLGEFWNHEQGGHGCGGGGLMKK